MKKIVWPMIVGLTLLVGCQNSEPKAKDDTKQSTEQTSEKSTATKSDITFPYPTLLSESDQAYSLLVIGNQDDKNPIEKNIKITKKVNDILSLPELEMAQKAYPELHIKHDPAYILFDQKGVVHQSKDLKELAAFLEQNTPN